MPNFLYRAVDLEHRQELEGTVEAADERAARAVLRERGIMPLDLEQFATQGPPRPSRWQRLLDLLIFRPVKPEELTLYMHQLAALIEAGMPMVATMELLEAESRNSTLKAATAAVRRDIMSGTAFHEALAKHPRVFPSIFVNMTLAGEVSGNMAIMITRMAEMLERNLELERKVKGAMTYPVLVLSVLGGVVSLMLAFVVPAFAGIYGKAGALLPLPTRILLASSAILRDHALAVGLLLVCLVAAYHWYRRTPMGRPIVDRFWLQIPYLGPLLLQETANTFARAFGTVYGAGVPILEALSACKGVLNNQAVADLISEVEQDVEAGKPLAERLKDSPYFPRMLAHMIAIGEMSGELEDLTAKAVDFSDRHIDYQVKQLTNMLEPALAVVMGVVVASVALSLYLPLFDLPKMLTGN